MAYKDKQRGIQYNNDFNKDRYDRVTIMLPKGSKDKLKTIAKTRTAGSVNELVKQALTMFCPGWDKD